jgi:hypothetical protein
VSNRPPTLAYPPSWAEPLPPAPGACAVPATARAGGRSDVSRVTCHPPVHLATDQTEGPGKTAAGLDVNPLE